MTQARAVSTKPFRDLRRAVAADQIVRALGGVGFTQKQIANAAGATDRSVRNWATTGSIRPTFDQRIRELSEIRAGGRRTWYGSSTRAGAWAEFARSLPDGVDPSQIQRRVGHADFDVLALDLTSDELRRALAVSVEKLTADDMELCQTLAGLAADAGVEAVLGPSAALDGDTTLAVFDAAIQDRSSEVTNLGVRHAREN